MGTISKKSYTSSNYELAYIEAQSFLVAASAISEKVTNSIMNIKNFDDTEKAIGLQNAVYVNHAYAFELLLKCISIFENGKYFTGHFLFGLFEKLNVDTQQKIESIFNSCNGQKRSLQFHGTWDNLEFKAILQEAEEAFKDFRYLFEDKSTPKYNLKTALKCVDNYILKSKPDLAKHKV